MKIDLKQEYKEFLESQGKVVPSELSHRVLHNVKQSLNPAKGWVLLKVLVIHAFASVVSLSVCPQFGFSIFSQHTPLSHLFHKLGPYGCMVACGFFFMLMSFLAALFVLNRDELRVLKKNDWLGVSTLAIFSLGFFWMFNAELILGFTFAWLIGAIISGVFTVEIGFRVLKKWN